MNETVKKLIKILGSLATEGKTKSAIVAMPKRPRSLATDALNSGEVLHLAKHIIKITLWPDISYAKGWLKEIKASLTTLTFKLCSFCHRKGSKRSVQELWYGPSEIMDKLNEILDSAYWAVVEDMPIQFEEVKSDPFVDNGGKNFSEIGYELRQEKVDDGIVLSLWLQKTKII